MDKIAKFVIERDKPDISGQSELRVPPWTEKQHRLFEAAAHDPSVAKRTGIPQAQAAKMASEGIKKGANRKIQPHEREAVAKRLMG